MNGAGDIISGDYPIRLSGYGLPDDYTTVTSTGTIYVQGDDIYDQNGALVTDLSSGSATLSNGYFFTAFRYAAYGGPAISLRLNRADGSYVRSSSGTVDLPSSGDIALEALADDTIIMTIQDGLTTHAYLIEDSDNLSDNITEIASRCRNLRNSNS